MKATRQSGRHTRMSEREKERGTERRTGRGTGREEERERRRGKKSRKISQPKFSKRQECESQRGHRDRDQEGQDERDCDQAKTHPCNLLPCLKYCSRNQRRSPNPSSKDFYDEIEKDQNRQRRCSRCFPCTKAA